MQIDVLCVGTAAYDLTFTVAAHPQPDDKIFASSLVSCGGGPAANAAVTVARMGGTAVFAGYLGNDLFGDLHQQELETEGVLTDWVVRGSKPTPVSTILAQPDGRRALIAYRDPAIHLPPGSIDFSRLTPSVILFDGHEPHLSIPLAKWARQQGIPVILDAGSLHEGTKALADQVDYLICSQKFGRQFTGEATAAAALLPLQSLAPFVAITVGERGLFWAADGRREWFPPFAVGAVDSTGAGDTFHGAFAWCVAQKMDLQETLPFAAAAAALCCTRAGARRSIPTRAKVTRFLKQHTTADEKRPLS